MTSCEIGDRIHVLFAGIRNALSSPMVYFICIENISDFAGIHHLLVPILSPRREIEIWAGMQVKWGVNNAQHYPKECSSSAVNFQSWFCERNIKGRFRSKNVEKSIFSQFISRIQVQFIFGKTDCKVPLSTSISSWMVLAMCTVMFTFENNVHTTVQSV